MLFVCSLFGATKILACDCPGMTTEQSIEKSKAVFSGEVIGFEYHKGIPNWSMDESAKRTGKVIDYETLVVKVRVRQWWKGETPMEIYLLTNTTRDADGSLTQSSCDFTFQKGETYLIFAAGKENDYRTSNCQRTRKLTEAKDDLNILGEGKAPLENKDEPNKSMDVRQKQRLFYHGSSEPAAWA